MRQRILTAVLALATIAAPASFAGSEFQGSAPRADRASMIPVQYRYDNRGYGNNVRRDPYATTRDYTYNRGIDDYGYRDTGGWKRSAKYVGGGAAAGAVAGGLIGHGKGAAVGALAGGVGGYLYKKHKDRAQYGPGY